MDWIGTDFLRWTDLTKAMVVSSSLACFFFDFDQRFFLGPSLPKNDFEKMGVLSFGSRPHSTLSSASLLGGIAYRRDDSARLDFDLWKC